MSPESARIMKGGDASARRGDLTVAALIIGLRGGMLIAKFLLALFIARFIGLDELGIYGLISGAAAVMPVVMRCGVFAKLSRDAVHSEPTLLTKDLRHYASGVIILYVLIAPAAAAVGWYFGHPALALLALAVAMSEHAITDVVALMTNLDRPGHANVLYALQSAAWIYVFIALALMYPDLRVLNWILAFWIGGSMLALAIAVSLVRDWPWAEAFRRPLQRSWFVRNVRASWRLYISEVVAVLTLYSDRYLLTLFLPLEQVGVFVLFWQMASAIGNLVGAGVLQVYRARLIRAGRSDDAAAFQSLYRESLSRGLAAGVLLSLAVAPAAIYLITFSKQPLAMGYLPLLGLMLVCLQIRIWADAAKNAAYTRQQDQWVMSSNLLSLLTGVALSFALIPVYGLYGVIGPMAAAQAIIIVFLALKSARPLPEHSA